LPRECGVARDLGPTCLELGAVEDGPVAHTRSAGLDLHLLRLENDQGAVLDSEDLAAPAVDDRHGAGGSRGQRVQRGDTGDGCTERERECPRGDDPDAQAGVAPGPRTHGDRLDRVRLEPGLCDESLRV
jgi:hypothetical protein